MSEQQQPQFGIEKIYLKDLSLEIPNAPQIFLERETPQIEINVHNGASPLGQPGLYEAVLTVTVTAKLKDKTAFLELDAVLGVLCPGTLLPYAREAVASVMTRAGFPPVMLQHMSFDAAYQERMHQLQQEQAAKAGAPG
jgi:preprotein translocase subunit SecB